MLYIKLMMTVITIQCLSLNTILSNVRMIAFELISVISTSCITVIDNHFLIHPLDAFANKWQVSVFYEILWKNDLTILHDFL